MSAALSIVSVDNTTDQITITAHGLNTGDGPVAIYTAAGTLPAPLAGVTDYWIIKTGTDTLKLATSSANALANTPIDLTTNGSGTLLLLVGIPYRRATTYAVLTQIKSADLDALQDSDTALWNLLTGQAQNVFPGGAVTLAGDLVAGSLTVANNKNVTVQGTGLYKHGLKTMSVPVRPAFVGVASTGIAQITPGTNMLQVYLPLIVGSRILAVRWRVQDSVTGPTKVQGALSSHVDNGAGSVIATSAASAGSGAFQTQQISGLTTVVASLTTYYLIISQNTGTALCTINNLEVDYDQP